MALAHSSMDLGHLFLKENVEVAKEFNHWFKFIIVRLGKLFQDHSILNFYVKKCFANKVVKSLGKWSQVVYYFCKKKDIKQTIYKLT